MGASQSTLRLLAISLGLAVLLIVVSLEAMSFAEVGLLSIGSITLVIVLLVRFVRAASKQERRGMAHAVTLMLVFLASMAIASWIEGLQASESMQRGDRVVSALASYHGRVGQYPDSLEQLLPQDLEALPDSAMAVVRTFGFEYSRGKEQEDEFVISFPTPMWRGFLRRSTGPWIAYE